MMASSPPPLSSAAAPADGAPPTPPPGAPAPAAGRKRKGAPDVEQEEDLVRPTAASVNASCFPLPLATLAAPAHALPPLVVHAPHLAASVHALPPLVHVPHPSDCLGGASSFDSGPPGLMVGGPSSSWESVAPSPGIVGPGCSGGFVPPAPPRPMALGPPAPIPRDGAMIKLRDQQQLLRALALRGEVRTVGDPYGPARPILLLAAPRDRDFLSEVLCLARDHIEVFTVKKRDVDAPRPGSKNRIRIGQVGLRCVHCRLVDPRERVKRASCYPSSIKRIYRTIVDMKVDHFPNCPCVPDGDKAMLAQLQQETKRSTTVACQYVAESAEELGMVDVEGGGVAIDLRRVGQRTYATSPESRQQQRTQPGHEERERAASYAPLLDSNASPKPPQPSKHATQLTSSQTGRRSYKCGMCGVPKKGHVCPYKPRKAGESARSATHAAKEESKNLAFGDLLTLISDADHLPQNACEQKERKEPALREPVVCSEADTLPHPQPPVALPPRNVRALLALPEDPRFLSPLRCFVRQHIYAFADRSGKVALGCVHCLNISPGARSKRAVCTPTALSGVYQAVADMQRFHFKECKMMPPHERARFLELDANSGRGNKGPSTKSYWITSARRIGLADGPDGLYFYRDPNLPPLPDMNSNLGVLAQAASGEVSIRSDVTLVTTEDRPAVAEFVYLAMEQLRPTQFSEADRSKRRPKDVGSVGVECRHCAGAFDGRKFFWNSATALESNFTKRLRPGSQKQFFSRVWARLQGTAVPPLITATKASKSQGKRKKKPKRTAPTLHEGVALSDEARAFMESELRVPTLDDIGQPPYPVTGQPQVARPPQPMQQQQQARAPQPLNGVWQSDKDVEARRKMTAKIVLLVRKRKPNASQEWLNELPKLAKRLEESLYSSAPSYVVYNDISTLKQRLQQLAMNIGKSKRLQQSQQPQLGAPVASPSAAPAATAPAACQPSDRLLLLRHAAKCPHQENQCPVTPHCAEMKRLWKHIADCKDQKCLVLHCVSSRYVLSHYHRCKDVRCQVCGPVREEIHRSSCLPSNTAITPKAKGATTEEFATSIARVTPTAEATPLPQLPERSPSQDIEIDSELTQAEL